MNDPAQHMTICHSCERYTGTTCLELPEHIRDRYDTFMSIKANSCPRKPPLWRSGRTGYQWPKPVPNHILENMPDGPDLIS